MRVIVDVSSILIDKIRGEPAGGVLTEAQDFTGDLALEIALER